MNLTASAQTSADSEIKVKQENDKETSLSNKYRSAEHTNDNTCSSKSNDKISNDCGADKVRETALQTRWENNQEEENKLEQQHYEFQQSPIAVQLGLSQADLTMMRSIGCQARCKVHKEDKEHIMKERETCSATLHKHHKHPSRLETEKKQNRCSQCDLCYSRCQHENVELSTTPPFYPSPSITSTNTNTNNTTLTSSSSATVTGYNPKHRKSSACHYNNINTHFYNSCNSNDYNDGEVAPFSDSELDEPIVRPLMCDGCMWMQRNKFNRTSSSSLERISSHSLPFTAPTPPAKEEKIGCALPDIRTSISSMKTTAAAKNKEQKTIGKNKEMIISPCAQESSHLDVCQTREFANIESPVFAEGAKQTPYQASFKTWRFPFLGRNDKSLLTTPAEGVLVRSSTQVNKSKLQEELEEEQEEVSHEQPEMKREQVKVKTEEQQEQEGERKQHHSRHRRSTQISSPCSFFSSTSSITSSSSSITINSKGNTSRLEPILSKLVKSNTNSKSTEKERHSIVNVDGGGQKNASQEEELYMPHRSNRCCSRSNRSNRSTCSNVSCVTVYINASAHRNAEKNNKLEFMQTDNKVQEGQQQQLTQKSDAEYTNSINRTKTLVNTATVSYDEDEDEREYLRLLHMVYACYLRNRQRKKKHRKEQHQEKKREEEEEEEPKDGKWMKIRKCKVKPHLSSPQTVPTLALCHSHNNADGKNNQFNASRQELQFKQEQIANSLTASTLLNRSASYYTRATHNGPIQGNRQSALTLPQNLRVLCFSSFASLPTRALNAHKNSAYYPHVECGSAYSSFSIHSRTPSMSTSNFSTLRKLELDQSILSKIEQRPLLQLTVFVRRLFARLAAYAALVENSKEEEKQQEQEETKANEQERKNSNVDSCVVYHTNQEKENVKCNTQQMNANTEQSELTGVMNEKLNALTNENEINSKYYKNSNHDRKVSEGEREVLTSPVSQPCSNTECNLARSIRYRRMLTPMERLVRHRHMLDGVEREVDNENLDLVVFVGMRLMGWLEVVSLLGAGSFGQVFLCKDLRICDGHFVNPNEMQGEDFVYWNCSHEYLPFGNSNNTPCHSPLVAVKVVKSVSLFEQQSVMEAEMLVLIGSQIAEANAATTTMSANSTTTTTTTTTTNDCSDNCGKTEKCNKHVNDINNENISVNTPNKPQQINNYNNSTKSNCESDDYGNAKYMESTSKANSKDEANYIWQTKRISFASMENKRLVQQVTEEERRLRNVQPNEDEEHPPESDPRCGHVAKVLADGVCYGHHCIVMERYGANLFEYIQHRSYRGLPLGEVQSIGKQLFSALSLLHNKCHIVHADIKPENLLLTMDSCSSMHDNNVLIDDNNTTSSNKNNNNMDHSSYIPLMRGCDSACNETGYAENGCQMITPSPLRVHIIEQSANTNDDNNNKKRSKENFKKENEGKNTGSDLLNRQPKTTLHIKLIDFSSSCYEDEACFNYIQSRYYRAPEVIVGAPYGTPIDIWSTGCVLAELFLGIPLLAGVNDHHQLMLIEEMIGALPHSLLSQGGNTKWYYNEEKEETQFVALEQSCKEKGIDNVITIKDEVNTQENHSFKLYSKEEYLSRRSLQQIEYTRYFVHNSLQELIRRCPLSEEERTLYHIRAPVSNKNINKGDNKYRKDNAVVEKDNKCKNLKVNEAGSCNNDNNTTDDYCGSKSKKEKNNNNNDKKVSCTSVIRKEIMHQRFLFFDLLRSLLNTDPSQRPTATRALEHAFFKTKFK